MSLFGGRRPLRPILGTQALAQVMIEVRSEDELRRALTPKDTTTTAALVANTGRRIVIAAPITLKASVVIAATLPGTTIEAHGHIPIYCGVDGIDAFDVQAALVTLRGLLLTSTTLTGAASLGEFATCVRVRANADFCRVLDCHTYDCDSLLVAEDTAGEGMIRGCAVGVTSSATANCVTIDALGWRIEHNILDGSGVALAVEVTVNGGRCAIVGNDCATDGITTSASSGSNTISANTRAGTIANHATDAVGLNT